MKVSPKKGMIRFGKREIQNPRYIGPFEILTRIGPVVYKPDYLENSIMYTLSTMSLT